MSELYLQVVNFILYIMDIPISDYIKCKGCLEKEPFRLIFASQRKGNAHM